jgi:hypothetical protein
MRPIRWRHNRPPPQRHRRAGGKTPRKPTRPYTPAQQGRERQRAALPRGHAGAPPVPNPAHIHPRTQPKSAHTHHTDHQLPSTPCAHPGKAKEKQGVHKLRTHKCRATARGPPRPFAGARKLKGSKQETQGKRRPTNPSAAVSTPRMHGHSLRQLCGTCMQRTAVPYLAWLGSPCTTAVAAPHASHALHLQAKSWGKRGKGWSSGGTKGHLRVIDR